MIFDLDYRKKELDEAREEMEKTVQTMEQEIKEIRNKYKKSINEQKEREQKLKGILEEMKPKNVEVYRLKNYEEDGFTFEMKDKNVYVQFKVLPPEWNGSTILYSVYE